MADINAVKELNKYMKMYNLLVETVDECIGICTDDIVENKLAEVKKKVDNIYNNEVNELCGKLSPDELTVVLLLSVLRQIEMKAASCDFDVELFKEVSKWLTGYQEAIVNDKLLSWEK